MSGAEKLLAFLQEKAQTNMDIYDKGISITTEEVTTGTGLNYYFQKLAREELEKEGKLETYFADVPRKLYYKLKPVLSE